MHQPIDDEAIAYHWRKKSYFFEQCTYAYYPEFIFLSIAEVAQRSKAPLTVRSIEDGEGFVVTWND